MEKNDSFGGQIAKWITPILLAILGFAMSKYFTILSEQMKEIHTFMTKYGAEHRAIDVKIERLELSDKEQDRRIDILMIDKYFTLPPETKIPKRK